MGAGLNRMDKYNVRKAMKVFAGYLQDAYRMRCQSGVIIVYDSINSSAPFYCGSSLCSLRGRNSDKIFIESESDEKDGSYEIAFSYEDNFA